MLNYFKKLEDQESEGQSLQVNFHRRSVKGEFKVFKMTDNGFRIVFIPALNLSGYGKDEDEAFDLLKFSIDEYFNSLFKLKIDRIQNELGLLGWKQDRLHHKRFHNVTFVDKQGILKNFNLPAETHIEEMAVSV